MLKNRHIVKSHSGFGNCKACGKGKINMQQWYRWYSLFDGRLLLDQICKDCAKRELGTKNKKGWDEYL